MGKSEKAYGRETTQTVLLTRKLVLALSRRGKYAEEEATRTCLLEIDGKVLGRRYPETPRNLGTLASLLYVLGEYDEAEEKNRLLLERQEAALGKAHPQTLVSIIGLALRLSRQGRSYAPESTLQRLDPVSYHLVINTAARAQAGRHP